MSKSLEKATITFLKGRRKDDAPFEVMFNPAEYTLQMSNNYHEMKVPGKSTPVLQFVNGELQTLKMELFFETWTNRDRADVSKTTQQFAVALAIDEELHAPPPVEFKWGSFAFQAVVQSLSQRFTMFAEDGTPVRATLDVTFKLYRTLEDQTTEVRPNSADKTKARCLSSSDSLWAMANREYGHPREWRKIAKANDIDSPRFVRPGLVLKLPPLDSENARGT